MRLQSFILRITFLSFGLIAQAQAFEMAGMVGYDINKYTAPPSNYTDTSNGIGYGFLARLELGPGMIESGFLYTSTAISVSANANTGLKFSGSYWMIPLMYRYVFLPPFLSLAVGGDYAVAGNTTLAVTGTPLAGLTSASSYKSHFGAQVSLAAVQDLGENLGVVLDLRYRAGLGNAIYFGSQATKYDVTIISLGIQKRLD